MVYRLRPVGLDFVANAPLRVVLASRTAAAPEEVFRALALDVPGWTRWFRAVTLARPVQRAGAEGREVHLLGGVRFMETVMAAEPSHRYAYRIDVTNVPGVRAMLEEWQLLPSGTGTVVRWTVALDAPAAVRLLVALGRPGLRHAFRDALLTLDRRLAAMRGGTR
ncbi:SRPBCC family protein [Streptomyces telluris]|uniref:SRPBCC family protein n=1 Tax=Streptomyces telluris TaxID=2720021 RepID=A0A9X2LED6_9ACTN|nr:SRPBCC family protein [Streptomyces telluris]MCQ8769789.1 SRPBCC family protein [Streptomyces telluris]NJP77306.1 SRPBCC family protein [Streptomyces telluris]